MMMLQQKWFCLLVLVRGAARVRLLTGGRLLRRPGTRDLLPKKFLDLDTLTEVARGIILVLETRGTPPIDQIVRPFGTFKPRHVLSRREGILACFDEVEPTLLALRKVATLTPLCAALDVGPLVEALDGKKRVLLGEPLERAAELLRGTPTETLAFSPELMEVAEVKAAFAAQGWSPSPAEAQPLGAPPALWVSLKEEG